MFNSAVLDVAIGLAFVYLTLALLCTALNEWCARQLKLRGKMLEKGILSLLAGGPQGNALSKAFYNSPLIKSITSPSGHPSYISPQLFALALTDALKDKDVRSPEAAGGPPGAAVPGAGKSEIQTLVDGMAAGPAKTTLQAVLLGAAPTAEAGIARISRWFEDSMDRVSGWYTRKIQTVTLIIAALITIYTNADTMLVVDRLWTTPTLRASIVARAEERAKGPAPVSLEYKDSSPVPSEPTSASTSSEANSENPFSKDLEKEKEALGGLLTWSPEFNELNKRKTDNEKLQNKENVAVVYLGWLGWLIWARIIGWIITVYAISLGAPFWFGMLQKLVNIRSAGDAPDEKKKAGNP